MSDQEFSLLDLFREEARSQTQTLSKGLLDLESDPANATRIEPLMRAAHSIKGAARIVGVEGAVGIAHVIEDVFVAAGQGRIRLTPPDIDLLLRGTDLLATLADVRDTEAAGWGVDRRDLAELIERFGKLARGEAVHVPRNDPALPSSLVVSAEPPAARLPVGPVAALEEPVAGPLALPGPPEQEAVVRVTAGSLNRLMSLAGESLVQARWLQPFSMALLKLKKQQDHLASLIGHLGQALPHSSRGENADPLRSMVAEAGKQIEVCRKILADRAAEFEDHAAAAEDLNTRLYREVIVSRMRPFGDGAHGFPRMVRDMARRLDKQVRLEIDGLTTEVDRDILEKLEAPLMHLIRNGVDHGIEAPAERVRAGKPEQGVIRLEVRHRAGMLALTISDDGGGIDLDQLRRKIIERKLAPAEMATAMTEAELLEFLFLPGFTTTQKVTEYSGRGVGLDVVQDTIRRTGGSVRISSRRGRGTVFHLQLPITLSVLRAVLVDIAGEPYAFPHTRIDRLLRIPRSAIRSLEHRQFVTVDGQNIGLVVAAQLLGFEASGLSGSDLPVLLMSDESGQYGLIVEAFRGEQDLVVRPLDARLGKVPNVSAAAILDDGMPVLIADVEDLIRSMDHFIQAGTLRRCDVVEKEEKRTRRVLVVDDSITVREVERHLLRNAGYLVDVAVDGQDGLNHVQAGHFDLLVTDVDMPRMNGLDLIRAVRNLEATHNLPIIIISYKDREDDRLRGLEVGANYYLTKSSFHDNTFLCAVADLIGEA